MVTRPVGRYSVYLADLDPVRGRKIAKTRPVVVISHDNMNRFLDTVVVCPLTSNLHPRWRSRIQTACAGRRAEIAVASEPCESMCLACLLPIRYGFYTLMLWGLW